MKIKSLWNNFSTTSDFPNVSADITTEVVIIGGGIAGVSIAQSLAAKGKQVVVLEARTVGGGTTAHSTGNLYATTDKNINKLLEKHGLEAVRVLTKARQTAIDLIESNVKTLSIDCDFQRIPWHLYTMKADAEEKIIQEHDCGKAVGLQIEYCETQYPYAARKMIRMRDQAQLNPKLYVRGLAQRIQSPSCQIYENSSVERIESHSDSHELTLKNGKKVRARKLIHATHTPKGISILQTLLGPYREYGIACVIEDADFEGTFWGYHGEENFVSSRIYKRNGERYLIVVGHPHKVGQGEDNELSLKKLSEFAHHHFKVVEVKFKWGGQHYRPADFLPYIGQESSDSTVYHATGFSTDGLTYGPLAGMIIGDLIEGKTTEISELLRPYRKDLFKSASDFIKENLNVAKEYLSDFPGTVGDDDFEKIALGEGRVMEKDGQKLAVFKSESGKLSVCSAVCTHMKCIINWNSLENSWDCPCHGSRFEATGELLEGPALHDLYKVKWGDANG